MRSFGKFWREMIRGWLVTHRWLKKCKHLNGIAIQNVSLPVLEQEEPVSVCVLKKVPLPGQKE